ncbi:phosphoglucomutase (alpha-D-glucose-1,6-bisphosphate-dependent) [Stomatohabitans albus]|uniref:phosphoglucomutase (alpha-D-glucose-1,6-bisphosphate-dependent) n=1 Tax=Stomatohabitans albus TaxID=3110766 RepID=UPI00300CB9A8
MNERAGTPATEADLINLQEVLDAYYDINPDPTDPTQQVAFGTSGHRGSSLDGAFNDLHIAAITQAIVEYRQRAHITGPVLMGRDTHALSAPAWQTALEVLAGNDVPVLVDNADGYTPTPALSHAIITLNREGKQCDGIIITPSHNPPRDGGFKYNPPHGGPADTDITDVLQTRANELMRNPHAIKRLSGDSASSHAEPFDYMGRYVNDLPNVVDITAIKNAGVRIGADPLGGASVAYWGRIAETFGLDLTVVNPEVDPRWSFMPLDKDGKIRMDCSSEAVMTNVVKNRHNFDLSTGNDADADRHGIVTPDGGLMNPNHFLAVSIDHLFQYRPQWGKDVGIGKTLVSSSMIDRVVGKLGRTLVEVPVGFKWFVPGLVNGSIGFGGEESAGMSFLRMDGTTWATDKDGIIAALLAAEIIAVRGASPSVIFQRFADEFGLPAYSRVDTPATREQKIKLKGLRPEDVTANELAGDPIIAKLTNAPGNDAPIGGLKVVTDHAWFAARPSGTENQYKIYAESMKGTDHLIMVQEQAKDLVNAVLG